MFDIQVCLAIREDKGYVIKQAYRHQGSLSEEKKLAGIIFQWNKYEEEKTGSE